MSEHNVSAIWCFCQNGQCEVEMGRIIPPEYMCKIHMKDNTAIGTDSVLRFQHENIAINKQMGGNHYKDMAALNEQIGGNHYKDMVIQPIEYITKNKIGYLPGNAIKYLSRYKAKGGEEDIKKAMHYCRLILEYEYAGDIELIEEQHNG